ncbi:hypothetical protein D3C73_715310 [compost metagenome]
MVKDSYGCTNYKKHLPIDGLNGAGCSDQKTIPRKNPEDQILSCLPAAFFGMGPFEDVAGQTRQNPRSVRQERTGRASAHFRSVESCRIGAAPDHPADH